MSEPPRPVWQTGLDYDGQDAGHYRDFVNAGLLAMVAGAPRSVIDLGCAAGAFGAALKAKFPGARVTGIEAGAAAAGHAVARLDRVVHARIEEVDLESLGRFDTVIAADVLEHLVDPWRVLVGLRGVLEPGAQVLASIPNVRNLWLVNRLIAEGRWEYTERGLLDVTHLRFFTLAEIRRLFAETGYRIEAEEAAILPSLERLHAAHAGRDVPLIPLGRLTLRDVTAAELTELCAEQFRIRARPA